MAQYQIEQKDVNTIISWIKSGEVAIPEIQRPFVWDATKVRDLLDSLYRGYPVGYIVVWKNPDVKLKDGSRSTGKKILIDGQQRITALATAVTGMFVVNSNYVKKRIKIAFNPMIEKFEVNNPAIEKNSMWIADVSEVFSLDFNFYRYVCRYCEVNNIFDEVKKGNLYDVLTKLRSILTVNFGVIELSEGLSTDEVTDIFIRINSKGVGLSQADFVMSIIASDERYRGTEIRKMIDYFCHLFNNPVDYDSIINSDSSIANSDVMKKIKWIISEKKSVYVPNYTDVLRVAFTYKFHRGKIADLVSLLEGRDFVTKENIESIAEESFMVLREGVENFVNENNFKRYLMIVKSTGIISSSMVHGQAALNFGYILYLTLREPNLNAGLIEKLVRRWLVLSILTGRYSGSTETAFDSDVKKFATLDPERFIAEVESGELSDAFWTNSLVSKLDTSVASSPYYWVYVMAQIVCGSKGFLSKEIKVMSLVDEQGDIHHLFPKKYLQKNGFDDKKDYNQIANFAYTQKEINIAIKDDAPNVYMQRMLEQINGGALSYGHISNNKDFVTNMKENCIPDGFATMDVKNYKDFLKQRRILIANFIRVYYEGLK